MREKNAWDCANVSGSFKIFRDVDEDDDDVVLWK